jgi:hypothetical protein
MNTKYRKNLPGTDLDYFDTRAAVEEIQPGAYAKLPYTSRVLAELNMDIQTPELNMDIQTPVDLAPALS